MKSNSILVCAALCNSLAIDLQFYVAPNSSDNNLGTSSSTAFQTLSRAHKAVRSQIATSMTETITVHTGSRMYTLSEPISFTVDDSGKGRRISGWTAGSNGVYSATVPVGIKSRNLYVNGQSSNYALRFINSFADRYAPVKSGGTRELFLKQHMWFNQLWGYDTADKPNADFSIWVQNLLALLTEGGQFYLDSGAGKVYYRLLAGENMNTIQAYLGVSETLVFGGSTKLRATNVSIKDEYFFQVIGNSITAGGFRADAHHYSDTRMLNSQLEISGNIFYNVSLLFRSIVSIVATYIENSAIALNDIYHTPYSAICISYS
ncbi:hypothetical protein EJ02DRAFT_437040 [Clathrospora elynae]|uniref:Uncharacterized protein n=1 Tax=Clathrospora elynae TaxID=706981 RepID=A0A6A5SGK3_9PLEO|nr:hypothetical protein EJ02DRAFT_437040 [Clathrospora elynae]